MSLLHAINDDLLHLAAKLRRAKAGIQPSDLQIMESILADEVRWGTRGELSEYDPEAMTATFDHRGDAMKFRRLLLRAGFDVGEPTEVDINEWGDMDYVVEIRDLR